MSADDVNGYNIKWIFFFFLFGVGSLFGWWYYLHVDTSHLLVVPRRRECLYTNEMEGRTIFLFFSIQEDPIHRDWLPTTLQLALFSSSSRSFHVLDFLSFFFLAFYLNTSTLMLGLYCYIRSFFLSSSLIVVYFVQSALLRGERETRGPVITSHGPLITSQRPIYSNLFGVFFLLLSWRVHIENHKPVVFITDWNGKILERHVRVAVRCSPNHLEMCD